MNGDAWARERSSGRFGWRDGSSVRRTSARAEAPLAAPPCLAASLRYGASYGGAHTLPVRSHSVARSSQVLESRTERRSAGASLSSAHRDMAAARAQVPPDDSVFLPDGVGGVMANGHHREALAGSLQAVQRASRGGSYALSLLRRVRTEAGADHPPRRTSHPPLSHVSCSAGGSTEVDVARRVAVPAVNAWPWGQQQTAVQENVVQG